MKVWIVRYKTGEYVWSEDPIAHINAVPILEARRFTGTGSEQDANRFALEHWVDFVDITWSIE